MCGDGAGLAWDCLVIFHVTSWAVLVEGEGEAAKGKGPTSSTTP